MNDIKVSLTITLPGRVMFSKQECLKQLRESYVDKKGHKRFKTKTVDDLDKCDISHTKVSDGFSSEILNIRTRKCKPATQSINLSTETYEYMISDACPHEIKISTWRTMKPKARLEAHLNGIAEYLGGTLLEYQVFED